MSTHDARPACWTLTETLEASKTTVTGHLWFTNPGNTAWEPLYRAAEVARAVEAERERCARRAETLAIIPGETAVDFSKRLAAAIREGAR